jgi:hypothetical protein
MLDFIRSLNDQGYNAHFKNRVETVELIVDNAYIVKNPRVVIIQDEKGDKIFY